MLTADGKHTAPLVQVTVAVLLPPPVLVPLEEPLLPPPQLNKMRKIDNIDMYLKVFIFCTSIF